MAIRLLLPIVAFVVYALWRGHSVLVVLGVSLPLIGLSLWAVSARSAWEAIEVGPEALSLISAKETVVIARQDIVKLSLDKRILVIKWQAQPKVRLAVIGKERFSAQAWEELQAALQGWMV